MNLLEGIILYVNEAWLWLWILGHCRNLYVPTFLIGSKNSRLSSMICVPFDHSKGQCTRMTRGTQGPTNVTSLECWWYSIHHFFHAAQPEKGWCSTIYLSITRTDGPARTPEPLLDYLSIYIQNRWTSINTVTNQQCEKSKLCKNLRLCSCKL